ncbi:hypothetical protein FRC11_002292, partial [Ceratobasidium sp. 423]
MPYDPSADMNFGPGNYNYAYITGTKQTESGPPVPGDTSFSTKTGIPSAYESAIWVYDTETNAITPQWTNTDGSMPATHILYADDGNEVLLLTGDPQAFRSGTGLDYPEV